MAYFNYRNLDPTEFEALAKDIMERLLGHSLFRYGQGKDGGIDLCDDIREKHVVVQCKKYSSFDNLYNVLKREEKPKVDKLVPRPKHYYVFTSLELLPQQKQKILDLFLEYMEGESCIVDGIAINNFFCDERNHDLIPRNIKLFISLPENYKYSLDDLLQIEAHKLYDRLFSIFENDRKDHPSIRMMDPDPSLFPKGLPEILSDGRLAVGEEEAPQAIREMLLDSWQREDCRHILLIGKGGIGKTVAMLMLPVEDWFKKLRIPVIYVPLQKLDAFSGDLNRYIREKIGYDNYDICIQQANSISKGHPRLLLLLDGFNEIPDDYKEIAGKQISEWMGKPGIQIITTSRLGLFLEKYFLKYQLQPLPHNTVRTFLLSAGIAEEQLPRKNDRIWEVINVPLMLTLYTQIEKVREAADRFSEPSIFEWKQPENVARIIWNYLQTELYRCIKKKDPSHSALQYALAILAVAPYVCCQMSYRNKFYLKREEFQELIQKALDFYTTHEDLLGSQIWNVREEYAPYEQEDLFRKKNVFKYVRILIDNVGLFQVQKTRNVGHANELIIDHTYSLMHQNFRDALAAFFICSCLPKTCDAKEKRVLLDQADYYVKDYMAKHLSGEELVSIWDKHRMEDPEDGHITFILMDLIGRQRNYDYRELDFSGLDLSKTNLHSLLSHRLDICPLPSDGNKLNCTKISADSLSPNGHIGGISSVAFSPDGRQLASCAPDDGTVRIWHLESGESRVLEGHGGWVTSVAYSPDGRHLASGGKEGTVRVWDLVSGESRVLERYVDGISSVAYSPNGRHLASGGTEGTVRIWDLVSGESRILKGHANRVRSVAFSPDGRQLASGADDSTVRIWNLASGESRMLGRHAGGVNSVAFCPDGRQFASGASDKTVRIWDLVSGESRVLEGHTGRVWSVTYSPNGRQLASGADDRTVRVWDLVSGESRVLEGHADRVRSVAYSPDGRHVASGADDRTVQIWDLESGESRALEGRRSGVFSVAFIPNGRQLASGASDSTVRIYDFESGKSSILEGHAGGVNSVAYSPDGRHLASGGTEGTVRIWDLANGEGHILKGHADDFRSVVFSSDGRQITSSTSDSTVWIFDLMSDTSIHWIERRVGTVLTVALSPDGRQLAIGADDSTVRVWDLESGECRVVHYSYEDWYYSFAFSPDGKQLASGSHERIVRIFDLESGKIIHWLEGHAGAVWSVAYSPDGRYLASGASDRTVRVWDLASGESRVLKGHAGAVVSVAFSSDGKYLASGASDNTVRIWDLDEFREVRKYAIISHINLSGANFELAIIDEKDKEMLRAAGAKV